MTNSATVPGAYDAGFFDVQRWTSEASAEVILPIVLDLLEPASLVDVGCGVGTWSKVALDRGLDVLGIDADYVDRSALVIPEASFATADLTQPLEIDRRFDLAISLEVGEHLPPAVARQFVSDLVKLAPAVLFSAAIFHQGGHLHLNEQPQSYWAGLFEEHGYVPADVVRPVVWDDPRVFRWYAQNTLLYLPAADLERLGLPRPAILDVVHPGLFATYRTQPPLRDAARALRGSLGRAIRRRAGKTSR
jgi:SAM-dependent methyltransferase